MQRFGVTLQYWKLNLTMDPVIVKVDFRKDGLEKKTVQVDLDRITPFDPNSIANLDSKTAQIYQYNGKHDNGPLPELKKDRYESYLVAALLAAKSDCDSYLTEVISSTLNANTGELESNDGAEAIRSKRTKKEECL